MAIDDLILFNDANTESGKIVVLAFVHARHLCCFTANKRGACQLAAFTDTLNYAGRNINVELAGSVVIQKEEWLCTYDGNIVAAHGDQVDTDGVVSAQLHGEPQFRSYTIGAGDEHGAAIPFGNLTQRTKTSQTTQYFRSSRCLRYVLYTIHQGIARIDVDTCVFVS